MPDDKAVNNDKDVPFELIAQAPTPPAAAHDPAGRKALLARRRPPPFLGDLRVLTDDTLYLLGAPDLILRLDQDLR